MNDCKKDDNDRIALAIKKMEEEGVLFKPDGKPNVPELMKRAEISRQRARRIAANGFKLLPHGNAGMDAPIVEKTGKEEIMLHNVNKDNVEELFVKEIYPLLNI